MQQSRRHGIPGNVRAAAWPRSVLLDILSVGYVPSSLLHAPSCWRNGRPALDRRRRHPGGAPARAVAWTTVVIAVGRRADVIASAGADGPVVRAVWRRRAGASDAGAAAALRPLLRAAAGERAGADSRPPGLLGRESRAASERPSWRSMAWRPRKRQCTESARRYGFMPREPPFRLADGVTVSELERPLGGSRGDAAGDPRRPAAEPLAASWRCSERALARDRALAADCVTVFDRFRARPDSELARARRRADPRCRTRCCALGLSYVMGEFRFHMTLTDRLANADRQRWRQALAEHIDRLPQGPVTVGLALVRQDDGETVPASCATSPCPARRDRGSATIRVVGPSGAARTA